MGKRPIVPVWNKNLGLHPLTQISPYLQNVCLLTEDPSLFPSQRFHQRSPFKQSIIKTFDLKICSGASTISMQLVKNVFLTREKPLSRKLEEILLVYILENNKPVVEAKSA